ncbi:MAG: ATP-binding protein, partial [Calothrix sp. SM1_7_51]|nr:ATP-binding protein [Calothrix sp. SM1_7_51]
AKRVSSNLCKNLSTALGVEIGKKNLRSALEERLRLTKQIPTPVLRIPSCQDGEQAPSVTTLQGCNDDPCFVGREAAIAKLNTLVSERKKLILIQAEGGVGKTTLARHYLRTQGFDIVIELSMAKERQNISSVEIDEWLKRYFNEEPGREFGISLERLRHKLEDKSKKIGILIDNLEPALEMVGLLKIIVAMLNF